MIQDSIGVVKGGVVGMDAIQKSIESGQSNGVHALRFWGQVVFVYLE